MEEEMYEMLNEEGSTVRFYSSSVKVKEELDEDVDQEFLEDAMGESSCPACINEKPGPNLGWDETENDNSLNGLLEAILEAENECCPPPLLVSTKKVDCVMCEMESDMKPVTAVLVPLIPKEERVTTSTRDASDSTRLLKNRHESCVTSFEETVTQGVVHNEQEVAAEESTHSTMFGTHTRRFISEEKNLFGTNPKSRLSGKELHTYRCSICLQIFPSKYRLTMHVFIHIDGVKPPKYVCKSCGEVFPSNVSLNKHLKMSEAHEASFAAHNEKFVCSDEQEDIFLEGNQEVSVLGQTGKQSASKESWEITEKCFNETCNTQSMTHDAMKQDRHDNYGNLSTTGDVSDHTVLLTEKGLHICDVCGKYFILLANLKSHLLMHTGTRPHECDICGKSFTLLANLKKHALIHTGTRLYMCEFCGKSFTQLSNLKSHLLIHTGTRPHKCDICSKSFTQLATLKKHALIHTGTRPHKCDTCGKYFTQLAHLKTHLLLHTGTRPHKCNICGKSFTQLVTLKKHALTHFDTRPHKCNFCGKSFTELGTLKRHVLIHTGTRPHTCDIYGKSFTQLATLKTHALIHTGTRPHKCDICGKSFTQLVHFKRHLLIHTGTRSHKCNICGQSFTRLSNLKKHAVTHAGKKSHKSEQANFL